MTIDTPEPIDDDRPVGTAALRLDGTDALAPDPGTSLREVARAEAEVAEESTGAALSGTVIRVHFEAGSGQEDYTVRSTNKDYIRWDRTPPARRAGVKSFSDAPFVFASFLGWSGGKREGLTDLTFDQFLELAETVERQSQDDVPPTQ